MKKTLFVLLALFGILLSSLNVALAATVELYVDAAPNVFGSPDYDPWWTAAKADVVAGTFVNMRNGINPANVGTTNFEIEDAVVHSFGDLGRRLTYTYWVPDETIDSLTGNFRIKLENNWDGVYSDFYLDYYGQSWLQPGSWENYDANGDGTIDGVIGAAGIAWWGANGINTPEALAADISAWGQVDESWTFTVDLSGSYSSITSSRSSAPVPEPTTILLLGCGLLGIAGVSRKK